MRLNWKILRLAGIPLLAVMLTGCGGLSATQGISPAMFLLPGIGKAGSPPASPASIPPAVEPGKEVAQF